MTDQIVIKLNKKKFQPLLDYLMKKNENTCLSYSECVGKSLYWLYLYFSEEVPILRNMTRHQYLLKETVSTHEVSILHFLSRYKRFLSS